MKNSKLLFYAVINSLGVFLYILLISLIFSNGERLFGKINNFFGPLAMLLLFVLSASITGILVLGRPIYLYLEEEKKDGIKMLGLTLLSLFIITLAVFIYLIIR